MSFRNLDAVSDDAAFLCRTHAQLLTLCYKAGPQVGKRNSSVQVLTAKRFHVFRGLIGVVRPNRARTISIQIAGHYRPQLHQYPWCQPNATRMLTSTTRDFLAAVLKELVTARIRPFESREGLDTLFDHEGCKCFFTLMLRDPCRRNSVVLLGRASLPASRALRYRASRLGRSLALPKTRCNDNGDLT